MQTKKPNLIKKFFKNKVLRSVFFLALWTLFVIFAYMFIIKTSSYYEYQESKIVIYDTTFEEIKSALLKENYTYNYIIVTDKIYKYSGNYNGKNYTGTAIVDGQNTEYSNVKEINRNLEYLNLETILKLFKDENEPNTSYVFENPEIYVKIRVSRDSEIDIEVNTGDAIYQMEFTNISNYNVRLESND